MQFPKKNSKSKSRYGIFKCIKCEVPHKKPIQSVKNGSTKCKHCAMTTHGNSYHKLYHTWINEVKRCKDPNHNRYLDYGGRGITISDEFFNDFLIWLEHAESLENCYKKNYTMDRINNDGNYEKGNLRWATKSEQALNRRTNSGK